MKNILNISLFIFNIIIIIIIFVYIKNNKKECFNNLKKFELYLGEHFEENNNFTIKCKKQKDELINCYKNKCSIHEINIANINLENCLENK